MKEYEQIIPKKTKTVQPDGIIVYTYDYGKQGTTTVRLIPPEDDSERARQEGHVRVQKVLNDIAAHIERDMVAQKEG